MRNVGEFLSNELLRVVGKLKVFLRVPGSNQGQKSIEDAGQSSQHMKLKYLTQVLSSTAANVCGTSRATALTGDTSDECSSFRTYGQRKGTLGFQLNYWQTDCWFFKFSMLWYLFSDMKPQNCYFSSYRGSVRHSTFNQLSDAWHNIHNGSLQQYHCCC